MKGTSNNVWKKCLQIKLKNISLNKIFGTPFNFSQLFVYHNYHGYICKILPVCLSVGFTRNLRFHKQTFIKFDYNGLNTCDKRLLLSSMLKLSHL